MTEIEKLEAAIKQAQEKLDELRATNKTWPQIDDVCCILQGGGGIWPREYNECHYMEDYLLQGNLFRTVEEAVHERDKRAVLHELKAFAKGFVPDWDDDGQRKWFIYYNKGLSIGCYYSDNFGIIYFATKEDAQAAIDALGDRLLVLWD